MAARREPRSAPERIAVFVGKDLLGDAVMKLPFLKVLRRAFPAARILWLASGKSVFAGTLAPLAAGLLDAVLEDIAWGESWTDLLRSPPRLPPIDLLLDTQRRVRTTLALRRLHPGIFVSAAAGWHFSARKPKTPAKPPAMLAQMLRLLEACGADTGLAGLPPLQLPAPLAAGAEARLPPLRPLVGLAPGAGGIHKAWPLPRFLALGQLLAARGLVPVVLLGPDERDWAARVKDDLPAAHLPLRPSDPPLFTMAIARHLALAVANDSGIGHRIAAAGTP
ncbi:MAG: glycosyltransferase family 9 protein, partial [Thermoplasmata archaeon]